MTKKKNKQKKIIFTIAAILIMLAIIGLFYFSKQQTILSAGGVGLIPITKESFIWNNIDGEITSTYIGSVGSGNIYSPGSRSKIAICGDNDAGDMSISNSFTTYNSLIMSSSFSSNDGGCASDGINFIEAKFTLPKGRLNGTCIVSTRNAEGVHTYSSCKIDSISVLAEAYDPRDARSKSQKDNVKESFEFIIEEEKEFTVRLETSAGVRYGSSEAKIILDFEPISEEAEDIEDTEAEEVESECIANIDCIDKCSKDSLPLCEDNICKCEDKETGEIIAASSEESGINTTAIFILISLIIVVMMSIIAILLYRRKLN